MIPQQYYSLVEYLRTQRLAEEHSLIESCAANANLTSQPPPINAETYQIRICKRVNRHVNRGVGDKSGRQDFPRPTDVDEVARNDAGSNPAVHFNEPLNSNGRDSRGGPGILNKALSGISA